MQRLVPPVPILRLNDPNNEGLNVMEYLTIKQIAKHMTLVHCCMRSFAQASEDVEKFLGLTNYFRKYILGYGAVSAPISDLRRKHAGIPADVMKMRYKATSQSLVESREQTKRLQRLLRKIKEVAPEVVAAIEGKDTSLAADAAFALDEELSIINEDDDDQWSSTFGVRTSSHSIPRPSSASVSRPLSAAMERAAADSGPFNVLVSGGLSRVQENHQAMGNSAAIVKEPRARPFTAHATTASQQREVGQNHMERGSPFTPHSGNKHKGGDVSKLRMSGKASMRPASAPSHSVRFANVRVENASDVPVNVVAPTMAGGTTDTK